MLFFLLIRKMSNIQINVRPHNVLGDCVIVYDVWTGEKKKIILTKDYLYDKIPVIIRLFEMQYLLIISYCFTYNVNLASLVTLRADLFVIENGKAVSIIVIYESEVIDDFYKKMFCVVNHVLYMVDEQFLFQCPISNLVNNKLTDKLAIIWSKIYTFKDSVVPSAFIICPGKKTRLLIIRDDQLVTFNPEENKIHFPNKLPYKLHGVETRLHKNHVYILGKDFINGFIHMYKIFTKCKFKTQRWIFERQLYTKMIFSNHINKEMGKIVVDPDYSMRFYYTRNRYHLLTKNEMITNDFFKLLSDCSEDTIPIQFENKDQRTLKKKLWTYRGKTSITKIGAKRVMGRYFFYYNPEEKCPKTRKRQVLTDLLIYFSNDKYFTRKHKMSYLKVLKYFEGINLNIQTPLHHMKFFVKRYTFK